MRRMFSCHRCASYKSSQTGRGVRGNKVLCWCLQNVFANITKYFCKHRKYRNRQRNPLWQTGKGVAVKSNSGTKCPFEKWILDKLEEHSIIFHWFLCSANMHFLWFSHSQPIFAKSSKLFLFSAFPVFLDFLVPRNLTQSDVTLCTI